MTIEWKDPNMKLHGKRHKRDPYYFRVHYGKQRMVYITKEYVDKPTKRQQYAREAFTALRREVARQLHDAELKAKWEAHFKKDNQGYKMLHTYVYAQLKAGVTVTGRDAIHRVSVGEVSHTIAKKETQYMASLHAHSQQETRHRRVSTSQTPVIVVWNGVIVPIFLPSKVPKERGFEVERLESFEVRKHVVIIHFTLRICLSCCYIIFGR